MYKLVLRVHPDVTYTGVDKLGQLLTKGEETSVLFKGYTIIEEHEKTSKIGEGMACSPGV